MLSTSSSKFSAALQESVKGENAQVIIMNNSIEAQISEMEAPEDKQMFMEEYKMTEPALDRLIHSTYKLLNLQTYFTAGVQEVRAWTIHEGWKAPQAASVIHTDFEKGFIKAEVIAYNDFITLGSEAACRDAGKLRIEGKESFDAKMPGPQQLLIHLSAITIKVVHSQILSIYVAGCDVGFFAHCTISTRLPESGAPRGHERY